MDPCDHINPDASSSGRRYGNPVSNFETPNRTKANQTSRCLWGQADKSSPRTHNHPLNAFQEAELSCSRSAQGQWGKTNKYVGGISRASTKNSTLYAKRKRPSSYTGQCQWTNEEAPPTDTYGKEESSYRFSWKNKNDRNSRNNIAAERASGLPIESRLGRRSLFDMDYEAETELQTVDYHSGKNHNIVAESKLKRGSNCDRLDCVRRDDPPYKSHDLVVVKTKLEESHDFEKTFDYVAGTGLKKRSLSPNWEHVVEPHPKKQNVEFDKTHNHPNQSDDHFFPNETQVEMKDNADNKKQPEKGEESVGTREALVSLVPGGATLSNLSIPQASEVQASSCEPPRRKRKRGKKRVRPFRMKLPSGERLKLKLSDAIALGLYKPKREDVTPATGDKQSENLHDKDNGNKNDQLEKKEDVPHTTDDNATKSCWNNKDNNEDKSYRDKDNINTWSFLEQLEKIKEVPNATESRLDQKDNHQNKSYHDKSNINNWSFLEQLKKIKEVPHSTDDNASKSRWDKRDNHRDKNCHDKGKDTVQKGIKIHIFNIKRELEEKIRKKRMIENSPTQISDYSNVQSNPTAATLLGSRKCEGNGTRNTVTKTVSENQNNSVQQAVSRGQLHFNTAPKVDKAPPLISNYQNPNLLLPGSKKRDTLYRMVLKKHLAVKLMDEDGVDFLQALGEKTSLKITVEKQMVKGNICYSCIFAGPAGQHTLEAQEAVERFVHPIGSRNVLETVLFKSDCSVASLRENLRIIDSSDKYWAHLAGLHYRIVLKNERVLKTSTNINELNLVKEVQQNYSILNAMILGKLNVADGPKHMRILRQWLQQSNANSTMTSTIGFSFNYVFNYDSALEIDYVKVIKRLSNDRKLEVKLKITRMLHIGIDICISRGWMEHLKHHKSLYKAVIISNYSADCVKQFQRNYSQLKENAAKVTFKHNTTNNSNDLSADIDCNNFMIPNSQANLGVVQTYSDKEVPQNINLLAKAGGELKKEDDPHATETQHLHCASGGAVQSGLVPNLSGNSKRKRERNNINNYKCRKQEAALMNTPLQHQNPPANLLHFPHAQGVQPNQPPHGVNLASVALPYKLIPLPIMIPLAKKVDSFNLVPATACKLFEAAGDDFLKTLCQQTNLNIDIIKDQSGSIVQYTCTLQGPNEEKLKAKKAIIKFCNGGGDVGSK